jgi:hypothetical protein
MWRSLVSVIVGSGLALLATTAAAAVVSTAFSGYEVFPGYRGYSCPAGSTCGTTFAGWTDSAGSWVPPQSSNGGSWAASITYSGTPGPGSKVTITAGRWTWRQPDATLSFGAILPGGQVVWPPDLATDIGCGSGVARFHATITTAGGTVGAMDGCLDDTHTPEVFPPRVWGNLSLG